MLHLKDLYCTKIVHTLRILRGWMGTGEDQELAAIVPRSYYTRGIGARQEESAETGGASRLMSRERDEGQFGG